MPLKGDRKEVRTRRDRLLVSSEEGAEEGVRECIESRGRVGEGREEDRWL
jgi:hypothetical protein